MTMNRLRPASAATSGWGRPLISAAARAVSHRRTQGIALLRI